MIKDTSKEMVTVATFTNAAQAHILENHLADEQIPSIVTEEYFSGLIPGSTAGTVKVQVAQANVEEARQLLARCEQHSPPFEPAPALPGDRLASRAANMASLGLFLFPLGLHLYSAYLLWRLRWLGLELSPLGREKVREAWRFNRIIFLGAALVLIVAVILNWR